MILTSNRGFAEWGEIFGDPVVATALLDRLLHHAVVIQIEGSSYRLVSTPSSCPTTSAPRLSSPRRCRHRAGAAGRRSPETPLRPPPDRPSAPSRGKIYFGASEESPFGIDRWCNYYRYAVAKRTFAVLDHHVWQITYKWARRRHPKKNRRWVVNHYYGVDQGRGWDLWDGRNRLPRHNETRVSRFVKVRGRSSPFDPSLRDYWEDRRARRLVREASHFHRIHLLQRQAGRCAACKAVFDSDLEQGGNTNIVVRRDPATGDITRALVHRWCRPGRSPRSTSYALADA